jgi:hypothetical protein
MSNNNKSAETSIWRNGYNFALLLLFALGITFVVLGAIAFPQGTVPNVILVGTGIAMAPGSVIAALFRVFLFREVQHQLTQPVINEVKERLGPELREQVTRLIEEYRVEITTLEALKESGVLCPYRRREMALKDFASAIDAETSEIMVIGSSLKGLLQMDKYKEIKEKLKFKVTSGNVRVKFLLTHPVVADLRAGQEARQFTDIGKEIIASLRTLKDWKVPPEDVRLYKGTPTVFAIKTASKMFLNPYPYGAVAFDSPCIIVESRGDNPSYFYDAFDAFHFGAWDTNAVERILDYNATIGVLESNLNKYASTVSQMLQS